MAELLTPDESEALTTPFHDLWVAAMEYAEAYYWDEFRNANPQMFAAFTPTTRANMLRDAIVAYVRRDNSVVINDESFGFPVQILAADGRYAVARFKLLDREMRPQNHVSGQQTDLDLHTFTAEQLQLAGIPTEPTLLTVGYQLTQAQDRMSAHVVVCRHNGELLYFYDLDNPAGAFGSVVSFPGVSPNAPRITSKIRKPEEEATPSEPEPE